MAARQPMVLHSDRLFVPIAGRFPQEFPMAEPARLTRLAAALVLPLCAGLARGQFAPPPANDPAPPAAAPAVTGGPIQVGLPDISLTPPSADNTGPLVNERAFATVRGNQPLTTNALLGYINAQPVFVLDVFRPIDNDLRRVGKAARSMEEFRSAARTLIKGQIEQLKSEILIISAAEATLSDRDLHNVEAYLAIKRAEKITENGGSVPAANKALQAVGSNLEKEMTDMRRSILLDLYFVL
jgi:hypothetical protein